MTLVGRGNSLVGWHLRPRRRADPPLSPLPVPPLHHAVDRIALQAWLDAGAGRADVVHVHLPLFPPLRTARPLVVTFHTPMLADSAAIAEPGSSHASPG